MESSLFNDDEEGAELFCNAKDLITKGDHSKALEIIVDLLVFYAQKQGSSLLHSEQARIFSKLSRAAATTENPNLAFTFLLVLVSCYFQDVNLLRLCAEGLHDLAQRLGSPLYYKECVRIAKQALYVSHKDNNVAQNELLRGLEEKRRMKLELLIKDSEFRISGSKTESIRNDEPKFVESKRSPEPVKDEANKGPRLFWMGLDVKIKRELMKVSIEKLRGFVTVRGH
ncbi:hypothetical protein Bca52824_029815 [Brassica carinata]|uniref:Uncharacterized protein n=1 Tax=Brassica carinata TaxID=52824 RepID=A0A8X7SC23_BRACI|nr:hypothetical protein Bca52824_029815 [Brassica carinata]